MPNSSGTLADLVSRLGTTRYPGSSVTVGVPYQDIPALELPAHRAKTTHRAQRINQLADFFNTTVLDLGCNVGTISHWLKQAGAKRVVGYDHDVDSIALASHLYGQEVEFHVADITPQFIRDLPFFDVIVWTSQFQWMVHQHGWNHALDALFTLSKKCRIMIFETAGLDDGLAPIDIRQDEVIKMLALNTSFRHIQDGGPWADGWSIRHVFAACDPLEPYVGRYSTVTAPSRGVIEKTYHVPNDANHQVGYVKELCTRELAFLELLKNTGIVPDLREVRDLSFTMAHCGILVPWISDAQASKILDVLSIYNVQHRDIRPDNLVWDGQDVRLVDFAYAIHRGELTNVTYDLGGKYRCPVGVNDEYSLRKVQRELFNA